MNPDFKFGAVKNLTDARYAATAVLPGGVFALTVANPDYISPLMPKLFLTGLPVLKLWLNLVPNC